MSERDDAAARTDAAARVYTAMRRLVLESDDRKRRVVDALGMSFARARALRALAERPIRMSELADHLLTDKPYTTVLVDDLERRGMVLREPDPTDRRAKIVRVTDTGRAAAERATEILDSAPTALATLEAEDLAELERILGKLDA